MERHLNGYLELPMQLDRRGGFRDPDFVASRHTSAASFETAAAFVTARQCTAILAIGLYGSSLARKLASHLRLPFFYRSHAIETEYHRQYFRLVRSAEHSRAASIRDAGRLLKIAHFERETIGAAEVVFEISADDLDSRRRHFAHGMTHLPPLAPTAVTAPAGPSWANRHIDIGYVGNLFMPNNLNGLYWFLSDVLPLVRRTKPGVRVGIAGKIGDKSVLKVLDRAMVDIVASPPDINAFTNDLRVGINPIFSGNGTTVKTIDLLWAGCSIVSTPIGVQGYAFPQSARLPLRVAADATSFADEILALLDGPAPEPEAVRASLGEYSQETWGPKLRALLRLDHS